MEKKKKRVVGNPIEGIMGKIERYLGKENEIAAWTNRDREKISLWTLAKVIGSEKINIILVGTQEKEIALVVVAKPKR